MANISSIATTTPGNGYSNRDILRAGQSWLKGRDADAQLFERFLSSSRTETRHFIRSLDEILSFNGSKRRAEIFEEHGPLLAAETIRRALEESNTDAAEIGAFIFTSCSSPVIPSIDGTIIQELGLDPTVARIPMYQHGCAGGVVGLSLAQRLAASGMKVLLTSVELCSLGFQPKDFSAGHLVGSVIFGDGAASAIISNETSGLVYLDTQSTLLPHSRHIMGYDILDDGAHLRLDRDLPSFLVQYVPGLVQAFLEKNNISRSDVAWWLFHPGGIKILNYLDEAFALNPEQSHFARDVLKNVGNLSSASVLFVASEFLRERQYKDGDIALMLGVGPGLTVELILFQVRKR